ncbi:MAG: putative toxin-antitoxin system toxin component, PIN family [Casimicrobium sp.]
MKIVIDTNVLVAGLYSSTGASFRIIGNWLEGKLDVYATTAIWLEYEDVLKRPEIVAMHRLGMRDVDVLLKSLSSLVTPVQLNYLWRPQLRDPKDEMLLEAAADASADAIVTHNVRDFVAGCSRFGIVALTPGQFVKIKSLKEV